jgi:hypothetical protein
MKTSNLIIISAAILSLASCKKGEEFDRNQLKWYYNGTEVSGSYSDDVNFDASETFTISLPSVAGANTFNTSCITTKYGDNSVSATAWGSPSDIQTLVNQKGMIDFACRQTVAVDDVKEVFGNFKLNIVNDREAWAGTYTVHDSIIGQPATTYTMQVASSSTLNNRLQLVGDFQQISGNTGIYIDITTPPSYQTVDMPSQTFGSYTFTGSGSYIGGLSDFVINYNDGTNNRAQRWVRQ